jgi:hypothetical protein
MNDQRIAYFRGALQALVESLDATARLSRWDSAESAPEPLQQSAAKLSERLGAANRLASGKFVGASQVVASLTGMSGAIKRLDAAYVQYRYRIDSKPAERDEAAVALDAEIGSVRAEVEDLELSEPSRARR